MELRLKRVIVVDHTHTVADSFVEVLRLNQYDAIAAYSGQEAVAAAQTFRPFAVLLDVMLPVMNGVDAAQLILQELPECRIILMSGHPETAEVIRAARPHNMPLEILPKPIEPQAILNALAVRPCTSALLERPREAAREIKPTAGLR